MALVNPNVAQLFPSNKNAYFQSQKAFRHHADFFDTDMFFRFLNEIKGSVSQIGCMIEANRKGEALFQLMEEIKVRDDVKIIDGSSFHIK